MSSIIYYIKKGIKYILSKQSKNGSWNDFEMSPGQSNSWVTAYVGLYLREMYKILPQLFNDFSFLKISNFLESKCKKDGGWGYNEKTRSDADSTAFTMLFLYDVGADINKRSWDRLIRFRKSDGGFSTFDSRWEGDNWGNSHSDVTPVVLKCFQLNKTKFNSIIEDGIEYIKNSQLTCGFWPSYWWNNNYYTTKINVQFLEHNKIDYNKIELLKKVLESKIEDSPFNVSQLLEILSFLRSEKTLRYQFAKNLCEAQNLDGSWKSKPMLRETLPDIKEPWLSDGNTGSTFSDINNILTTVSSIRALSIYYSLSMNRPWLE